MPHHDPSHGQGSGNIACRAEAAVAGSVRERIHQAGLRTARSEHRQAARPRVRRGVSLHWPGSQSRTLDQPKRSPAVSVRKPRVLPRDFRHTHNMDADACYRAASARDPRFDGLFFTAVRTTRIFCRSICPARTPLRKNVEFFFNAAAAMAAGYRPCLRCRPEVSPDHPAWGGTSSTVNRALRLIEEGALDQGTTETLANRLGLTDRHLRRLFLEQVGVPPVVVAQTRRVLFAKRLITETNLPFSQIAFAAGFSSLRRFNEALRNAYRRNPKELRRLAPPDAPAGTVELKLHYRPPYDWNALLEFIAPRAVPALEQVSADSYRRAGVEITQCAEKNWLVARITPDSMKNLRGIADQIRSLFDLRANTFEIGAHLGK